MKICSCGDYADVIFHSKASAISTRMFVFSLAHVYVSVTAKTA